MTINTDGVPVTVAAISNQDPSFFIERSAPENSAAETNVGDPVSALKPNVDDTLAFSVVGTGSENVTVSAADGGAQIQVATWARLDFETTRTYDLTLQVSDGKDASGNTDASVDHSIGVRVNVEYVLHGPVAATLHVDHATLAIGDTATFTLEVTGEISAGATERQVGLRGSGLDEPLVPTASDDTTRTYTWDHHEAPSAGDLSYGAFVKYLYHCEVVVVPRDLVTVTA